MQRRLSKSFKEHFEWLSKVGMKCNMTKTELMMFDEGELNLNCGNSNLKSGSSMKILGVHVDSKLSWEIHVSRMLSKIRSHLFTLRFIRKHLSIKDTINVVKAQIVSRMTYGAPVWSISLNYRQRAQIRSVYFLIIRTVLRDFGRKLSRSKMLKISGMESIDDIFFKRTSMFIFNVINNLSPTSLISSILSKAYFNERHPGEISFFDTSKTKIGKKCITNAIKNYTENWKFEWFGLSKIEFKSKIRAQFQTEWVDSQCNNDLVSILVIRHRTETSLLASEVFSTWWSE